MGRGRTRPIFALLLSILAGARQPAAGHSFAPCLLTIHEASPGEYTVVWRPPGRAAGYNLSSLEITPTFAPPCTALTAPRHREDEVTTSTSWRLRCPPPGLPGTMLHVAGIDGTQLDVVVRITWHDQSTETTVLRSGASSYRVPTDGAAASSPLASAYIALGIEHILIGADHLAFVLALFLLVPTRRVLLSTITAFTMGHSLTLALAALGILNLPVALTEALIALSIAFVARELVATSAAPSLTRRYPWVVALSFGLLHGLGFAAALSEIGIPPNGILVALLSFNLGVEIGQIVFVVLLLVASRAWRTWSAALLPSPPVIPYAIGGLAFFWVFERVLRFWS